MCIYTYIYIIYICIYMYYIYIIHIYIYILYIYIYIYIYKFSCLVLISVERLITRLIKIDNTSDESTRLIMNHELYCPWNIISLNEFLWMKALDWMIFNNTKSKQFRVDCYIIQLVSTHLSKNRSSRNVLVSRKTILAYELPMDLKSSDTLKP